MSASTATRVGHDVDRRRKSARPLGGRQRAADLDLDGRGQTDAVLVVAYFCDLHSPWQRGANENTNGLLRQYFPEGTDLSVRSPAELVRVAAGLNGRPRKTLGWKTPAEAFAALLSAAA